MQKLVKKVISVYSSIIQEVVVAENQNEIKGKELKLYAYLVGPLIMVS